MSPACVPHFLGSREFKQQSVMFGLFHVCYSFKLVPAVPFASHPRGESIAALSGAFCSSGLRGSYRMAGTTSSG